MAKGWRNESRRHSLAARGIKTSVSSKPFDKIPQKNVELVIEPTFVPRGSGNNPMGGKRDLHYKIKEWGYIFPSKEAAKKYADEHIEINGVIVEKKSLMKDSDGDGMTDKFDCDPNNPKKQGFFDDLKRKVVGVVKGEKTPEQIAAIRKKLEEKEEALEKKKQNKLVELSTRTQREIAVAELKAKEKELDLIQDNLEKNSTKALLKSIGKQTAIIAGKGLKRVGEEFSSKKIRKFTPVSLSKSEIDRTSVKTQKKLISQQKKNAEIEAKITLKNLKSKEKNLQEQLKIIGKNKDARTGKKTVHHKKKRKLVPKQKISWIEEL